MKFNSFYYKDSNQVVMDFDDLIFDKNMKLEGFYITNKNIHSLIKEGVLVKNMINEADDETDVADKDKKNIVKIKDEEGKEVSFEVALGNVKIGGNTVLLNMSTAAGCMSAIIGTCSLGADGKCYAARFEKQWAGSLAKNIRHEKQWACLSPLSIAKGLDAMSKQIKGIKFIRINEAGEFRNLPADPAMLAKVSDVRKAELAGIDDIAKLKSIAKYLKEMGSDLILYTYTHRSDLTFGDMGENVCINGSGWMIDNAFIPLELDDFITVIQKINSKTLTEFNGVPVKHGVHCLGDCRKCNFCKTKTGKHIFLPVHGSGTDYDITIRKLVDNVLNNEKFNDILSQSLTDKEKGRMIFDLLSDDDKSTLAILVPILSDRIDLFTNIIKSKGNINLLKQAIEQYASKDMKVSSDGSVDVDINNENALEGLAKSVDSLTGKFAANMEAAIAAGQAAATQKWDRLSKALQSAITAAKSGKEVKVSKALAKQFVGVANKDKFKG